MAAAWGSSFSCLNPRYFVKHYCKPPIRVYSMHSASSSPFTEAQSLENCRREGCLYKGRPSRPDSGVDETDIVLQIPELKKLLQMLKAKRQIQGSDGIKKGPGHVFLVGAGPGDPELLTLKAVRVVESADILLYDRLVSNDVLDLVKPDAKLLFVGKSSGYHSRTQEEIHELLLSFAEVGATVVRLKGGDPLVFGRGGEEMDFLTRKGIEVKVIPGITSASGIAAQLGIPLTHRGVANSVRFLTGHSKDGGSDPVFIGENAADLESTLVIYMGLSTMSSLALRLISHGLPAHTPAVAVERGTTPQERIVFSELKGLADDLTLMRFVSPTLIIIGNVVSLSPLWPRARNSRSVADSYESGLQTEFQALSIMRKWLVWNYSGRSN